MNEYTKILQIIKKKYLFTELLLEVYLENYHNNYIYIRIDYYKKLKKYKLSWIDLKHYQSNFESIVSYEYMPEDMINYLKELLSKLNNDSFYKKKIKNKYKVHVNVGSDKKNTHKYELIFNQFIHKNDKILYSIFNLMFENLPNKLWCFFEELGAMITGTTGKYECEEEFEFDLFNGDVGKIFEEHIQKEGEKFYQEGRVLFLEQINDYYVAIVGDTSLYVVTVKYARENNNVQMVCACSQECCCYHFMAVILAIRNNKINKFYKVIPKREKTNLLDRVMNFQYFLSIGMDDQGKHFLIIENNQLKLLPVLDKTGECVFDVLEDDSEDTLTKRIKEVTSKNKL